MSDKTIKKATLLPIFPENRKDFFNVSVSKIKSFKQCKSRYLFEYIKKLPKKEKDFAQFGTFVHEVLEFFANDLIAGSDKPEHEIIQYHFNNCRKLIVKNKEGKEVKKYNLLTDEEVKKAQVVLQNFLSVRQSQREQNKLPTFLFTEKEAILNIEDIVLFNGYVDLIQRDYDGVLHVVDYKTVDKEKSIKYLEEDLLQLETYAFIMFLENPELQKIRCSYSLVRFDFRLITKEYTREESMKMHDKITEYVSSMKEEKLFRAETGPLCPYCDFLSSCPEGEKKAEQIERYKNKGQVTHKPIKFFK
jgi:RecB family exonuclease